MTTIANALNINFLPNQLIWANGTNSLTGLATAANGILITSSGSVPSISSTLPIAVQNNITNLGTIASIGAPLGAQFGGTGITNLATSTITLGGAFTMAGAFTFIGNITANTNITFPTSGTLATTAGASGIVSPGLINQLAYYAAAGSTVSGVTIVNSAALTTTSGGVPTWVAYTGTGAPVLATSPTLVTPALGTPASGVLTNCTGLPIGELTGLGTGVAAALAAVVTGSGGIVLTTSPTLVTPTIGAAIAQSIGSTGTQGVPLAGTTAGGNATAGNVGELMTITVLGTPVSLSNITAANLTTLSLTAGDWDVYGNIWFTGSTANMTTVLCWLSLSSATLPSSNFYVGYVEATATASQAGFQAPFLRVSVSSTTSVYLSGYAAFATGTVAMTGSLYARRVR